MSSTPTIQWPGRSGSRYQYWIYPLGTSFKEKPGNYIFAKEVQPGRWRPIYVGQTENLGARLPAHEKEGVARKHGATHVHTHVNESGEGGRKSEEADLISHWNPVCNVQLTGS